MPQQNGRAECFNQTLFEKSEAMRHQACLPRSWWEFCVEYSVHVYNRTPIKCLKSKTPYEAINRIKPDISHLRILGCGAYVFLHEDVWQDILSLHASSARSQTLTEPGIPASEIEESRTQPMFRRTGSEAKWEYEITIADGSIRHHSVSPNTHRDLWILVAARDGTVSHCSASPTTVSRVMARCKLMESPLAPRSTAIP